MRPGAPWAPLCGRRYAVPGDGAANAYARALLAALGAEVDAMPGAASAHPALAWARSGLMALTGPADGAAQLCPFPLAACADGVVAAIDAIAPRPLAVSGAALLGERAASAGHRRAGAVSAGGSCRLLRAGDGWLALNLARPDDWSLLPAWLETDAGRDWHSLGPLLARQPAAHWVERGRLLGLAVAAMAPLPSAPVPWYRSMPVSTQRPRGAASAGSAPLVVDLSALWAGPLCGHLLQRLGARVVKVESLRRPDGARLGPAAFHDLLNAGKASVALDFGSARGREQLRALLRRADIVIEASRPRALRQLGIEAESLVDENPALTWISITGHGRDEPQADWIAFGDDAGVAAGLSHSLYTLTGRPLFCGDAIGDPLTGLHAALLAWSGYVGGGGRVAALALRDVVAHCAQFDYPGCEQALRARWLRWQAVLADAGADVAAPRVRTPPQRARELGADTRAVLAGLGIAC